MIKEIIKSFIPWTNIDKRIYKLYKKSHKMWLKGRKYTANYYAYKIYKKYGCHISPIAQIGENLQLPHPIGVVIGEGVKIGNNCVIYQNVTIRKKT